jgi:hypothetical protein
MLSLQRSRSLLGTRILGVRAVFLAFSIAVVYALISMVVGQMLILGPTVFRSTTVSILYGPDYTPWWNFPAVLITAPNAVVALPFFGTLTMLLVSAGVGLGMSVALVLSVQLYRRRRSELVSPAAVGSVAGLTPAMFALLTLGACCSTTAVSAAGIGLASQATGTSVSNLLLNTWYLGVFQVVVLWVALVAQEQLVTVYGVFLGEEAALSTEIRLPPVTLRSLLAGLLRVGLILGGVSWCLAAVAQWTTVPPLAASPVFWFSWLFPHFEVGLFAVAAGISPEPIRRLLLSRNRGRAGRVVRASLFVGGLSLLLWFPAALSTHGAPGFLNELLGALGYPASVGGVSPGSVTGLALGLRWGFQYLLIGLFALGVALAPGRTLGPFAESGGGATNDERSTPSESEPGSGGVPGATAPTGAGRGTPGETPTRRRDGSSSSSTD